MKFEWTGDLCDDCTCKAGPLLAHVECLSDEPEVWHASVNLFYRVKGDPDIFRADTADIIPKTGEAARWLCELVMRDWLAKHEPPAKE